MGKSRTTNASPPAAITVQVRSSPFEKAGIFLQDISGTQHYPGAARQRPGRNWWAAPIKR